MPNISISSSSSSSSSSSAANTNPSIPSRSIDNYEILDQVGEGTYGYVYKGRNKETKEMVAIKQIRTEHKGSFGGFPLTAIREMKLLQELRHNNLVRLIEIVTKCDKHETSYPKDIYLVFEYMDHDLAGLMESPHVAFSEAQVKCYMKQLFTALHFCHSRGVLHRDIKGSNLLINNNGILKLADFGLARMRNDDEQPLTNRVITLWYRPPELLLGATAYTEAVDMWSAGCLLAELLSRKYLMRGREELEQLDKIFKVCGTPTPETWPGARDTKLWSMLSPKQSYPRSIRKHYYALSPEGLDLVDRLLTLDPEKRLSAKEALSHPWFKRPPFPANPTTLPQYPASHEYEAKQRRKRRNQSQETNGSHRPPEAKRMRSNTQTPSASSAIKPHNQFSYYMPPNPHGSLSTAPPSIPPSASSRDYRNNSSNYSSSSSSSFNYHQHRQQPSSHKFPPPSHHQHQRQRQQYNSNTHSRMPWRNGRRHQDHHNPIRQPQPPVPRPHYPQPRPFTHPGSQPPSQHQYQHQQQQQQRYPHQYQRRQRYQHNQQYHSYSHGQNRSMHPNPRKDNYR